MIRFLTVMISCLALAACGSTKRIYDSSTANPGYKVGKPYKVAGKIYHPRAEPDYDKQGLASWYGPQFHGRKTANGDVFNMNALTAAHTTLPMPSYVRVTNEANGRWLILKINDRGPFVGNRLIDVSRRAAQLLGFEKKGVTRVRVQAVNGPKGGAIQQAAARTTPEENPNSAPVELALAAPEIPITLAANKKIYIQIGAYADQNNADKVLGSVNHISETKVEKIDMNGENLYRVRTGPYLSVELAEIILGRILSLGHNTARIIRD